MNRTITISQEVLKKLKENKLKLSYSKKRILTWNEYFNSILNLDNGKNGRMEKFVKQKS